MRSECPLCAKSRHPALFDCLVGKLLELCGHLEAQRFSSLQIDDQLEFGRLLHSNSAGWAPLRILSTYGAVWRARSARLAPYDSRVDVVAQHRACHRSPDHSWLRHAKVWLRVVPRVALNRAAAQCLLRVKSRHRGNLKECPLYPQKRTLHCTAANVRFVPKADILRCGKSGYSITSSAMLRSVGGNVRPSIRAVE